MATIDPEFAKAFSHMLSDLIYNDEDFGDLANSVISEVTEFGEHYMSSDQGIFIKFDNGIEVGIKVQAIVPEGTGYDHCGDDTPHKPHQIVGSPVRCTGTTIEEADQADRVDEAYNEAVRTSRGE